MCGPQKQKKLTTASDIDMRWIEDERIHEVKPQFEQKPATDSTINKEGIASQNQGDPQAQEALQKAMQATISSNQIMLEATSSNSDQDDNKLNENEANPENNLEKVGTTQKQKSPYTLQAGTIIPAILISGINSDLPGEVSSQVRNPVYDSVSGKYLLIPQGAKLIGSYESKLCFGQKRLFLIWTRLIFPNGDSINLGQMPASDVQGYAGLRDQVDSHYGPLFASSLLMSILSAGGQMASPKDDNKKLTSPTQALANSFGMHMAETGTQLISKAMEVQPTINIRPGLLFNITVTKDIVFDRPDSGGAAG